MGKENFHQGSEPLAEDNLSNLDLGVISSSLIEDFKDTLTKLPQFRGPVGQFDKDGFTYAFNFSASPALFVDDGSENVGAMQITRTKGDAYSDRLIISSIGSAGMISYQAWGTIEMLEDQTSMCNALNNPKAIRKAEEILIQLKTV